MQEVTSDEMQRLEEKKKKKKLREKGTEENSRDRNLLLNSEDLEFFHCSF